MSEHTPCNRCTLNRITARAEARGATVTCKRETLEEAIAQGGHSTWYVVRVSDRPQPVAWLMELTDRCVC